MISLSAFPRGLFQHGFSLLVYSRAFKLESLNMEIPAAVGTGLSQLAVISIMLMVMINWH